MLIKDMTPRITSRKLNENLAKQYGYNLNISRFSGTQLEDVRNKLRTKLSQLELSESYGDILSNPEYQKTKMFLDIINTEIFERSGVDLPIAEDANIRELRQRAARYSVPESWINSAIKRIQFGESEVSELSEELTTRYSLTESEASWILLESEEIRASIIMRASDMIDRITGWYEDVAAMKSEQFLELVDDIGEIIGSDAAQQYIDAVKPALESMYTTFESVRAALSQGLDVVTGESTAVMGDQSANPEGAVGGQPPAPAAPAAPAAQPAQPAPGDEMGGAAGEEQAPPDAAAIAGRMKRESIAYGNKLGVMLSEKKRSTKKSIR